MAGVKDEEVSRLQHSHGCHGPSPARPSRPRRPRWSPRFEGSPWIPRWSPLSSAAIFCLGHRDRLDGPGGGHGDTAVRSGIARCRTASRSQVRVSASTELTEPKRFAYGYRAAWLADRSAIVSGRSLKYTVRLHVAQRRETAHHGMRRFSGTPLLRKIVARVACCC
jgi:hypothetical protein